MYTSIKNYPNMVCPICHDEDILAIFKDNSRLPVLSVCYNCHSTFEVLPNLKYVAPKEKTITKPEELFPIYVQYYILLYGLLSKERLAEHVGTTKAHVKKRFEGHCRSIKRFCLENNLPLHKDTKSWDYYTPYMQKLLTGLPYTLPSKFGPLKREENEKLLEAAREQMDLISEEEEQLLQEEIEAKTEFYLVRIVDCTK